MATPSEVTVAAQFGEVVERPGALKRLEMTTRKQPLGSTGALIVLAMILSAGFARWVTNYDPVANFLENQLTASGAEVFLWTDQFGRDLVTRIIYGGQTAVIAGFASALFGATVGLIPSVASAHLGGAFDLIIQWVMDVFMGFPLIIVAITIAFFSRCTRVVRISALAIQEIPYIDAAHIHGSSSSLVMLRYMAPNVLAPFLIMGAAFVRQAILLEASLSYLGLSVQEPTPALCGEAP